MRPYVVSFFPPFEVWSRSLSAARVTRAPLRLTALLQRPDAQPQGNESEL